MKKSVLLSGLLAGIPALLLSRRKNKPRYDESRVARNLHRLAPTRGRGMDPEQASCRFLMYGLLPFWFVPGVLDWLWHRQTKIETTAGIKESLIHVLMMTEVGVPILLGLFFETNAGMLALMTGASVIHQATAIWDVSSTVRARKIPPREQHTHTFTESLPFMATAFLACLHPNQFLALFGKGPEEPRFGLELRRPPLPPSYTASILAAVAVFVALPYGEELLRCWRAKQKGLAGRDIPRCARELYAA